MIMTSIMIASDTWEICGSGLSMSLKRVVCMYTMTKGTTANFWCTVTLQDIIYGAGKK
jgi:hypothetical protein